MWLAYVSFRQLIHTRTHSWGDYSELLQIPCEPHEPTHPCLACRTHAQNVHVYTCIDRPAMISPAYLLEKHLSAARLRAQVSQAIDGY